MFISFKESIIAVPLFQPLFFFSEKMEETSVMNNYFGIGIDAKISLDFHNKREESSSKASRTKNLMWYGMLGSKELVAK